MSAFRGIQICAFLFPKIKLLYERPPHVIGDMKLLLE